MSHCVPLCPTVSHCVPLCPTVSHCVPLCPTVSLCIDPLWLLLPQVAFDADGTSLLAALGSGDVAVVDLRMGTVRALVQAHARTCFGAAFVAPPLAVPADAGGRSSRASSSSSSSSSSSHNRSAGDCDTDIGFDAGTGLGAGAGGRSGRHCLTWSSDCSVRLWDISCDGLVTHPLDMLDFPQYPVYCCAVRDGAEAAGRGRTHAQRHAQGGTQLACVGGSGDTSFVGTPVHLFVPRAS